MGRTVNEEEVLVVSMVLHALGDLQAANLKQYIDDDGINVQRLLNDLQEKGLLLEPHVEALSKVLDKKTRTV